jgi:hypothetical protein
MSTGASNKYQLDCLFKSNCLVRILILRVLLVPHSQCSLGENPKFFQNFDLKVTQLKEIFCHNFYLISTIVFLA